MILMFNLIIENVIYASIINDYKVFDQDQIANQFNKFFGSVGHTMAGIIPSNNTCNYIEYLTENINYTFNFQPVNSCQIQKNIQYGK